MAGLRQAAQLAAESDSVTLASGAARVPVFQGQQEACKLSGGSCQAALGFAGGPVTAMSCAPMHSAEDTAYVAVSWISLVQHLC